MGLEGFYGGGGYGVEGGRGALQNTPGVMEVGPCRGWGGSLTSSAQCQGRWYHRGAGTWHWEVPALTGTGSGEQCGGRWHGLGGVSGPFFGCRARSCVR